MKRVQVFAGAIPQEVDVLNGQKNTMIAIGHVLQDMIGTSTLFSGLGCVPTSPAGMTVNVNPGRAYSLQATDSGAYSSLVADPTPLVKQGILLAAQNFSCPAPTTAGYSINYLVQGAFQEVDGGSTVLPFYNASNPAQAYSGPNGTGTSSNTYRDNTVQLALKAGVAATTGSQITPTPDAGYNGLWVITVAYGATTITSSNISQYSGAPFLTSSLLSLIQQGGLYAVATGTANAHVAAFNPPVTTRTDGMVLRYKAPAANTGALTFNDGLGAVAVVGAAHAALQGSETATNGDVWLQWNSSIGGGSYVLIDSTGGAAQIAPATQSQHAMQLGQATGRLLRTTVYYKNAGTLYSSVNGGAFAAAGSSTFTPLAATQAVDVEGVGGGGGSGGTATTSGSQISGSGGGSSGAYGRGYFTSGFSGVLITCGVSGAAGAASGNGGNGGTSSFGSLLTCPGGGGSTGGTLATTSATLIAGGGTAAAIASGGYINTLGGSGGAAIGPSGSLLTGSGGSGPLGSGGYPQTSGVGTPGTGYGSGAGGSGIGVSTAGAAGGAGAPGAIIVREYA